MDRAFKKFKRVPSGSQDLQFYLQKIDPVVQLVRMPPCHGGGRGFESRPDRDYFTKVAQNAVKHRFYGIFLFMLISKSNKFAHIFSDLFSDLFQFQK